MAVPRARSRSLLTQALLNPLEKFAHRHSEAFGDLPGGQNCDNILAALHQAHVGSVNAHVIGKPFLGEPLLFPRISHHRAKGFRQFRSFHSSRELILCGIQVYSIYSATIYAV